jgi:acetylserotonin N-methyltransferase
VIAGDLFTDPLPKGDLYVLGRILHDWSEDKIVKLLRRIYGSLPSTGAVLIAEKLLLGGRAMGETAAAQALCHPD